MEEVSLIIITEEEQDVRDAQRRYDKVNAEFNKWENEHPDYSVLHPEYVQLQQLLTSANQVLKDARAAANEKAKHQPNAVVPTTKKQKIADNDLPEYLCECIAAAQEVSLEESDVGKLVAVPKTMFSINCRHGLFIREEYLDVAHIIKTKLASDESIRRVLVLGSPGIGKSVFGLFLFLLGIKEKKDVAYHPMNAEVTYYFTWNETEYDISDKPCAGKTYEGYFDGNDKGGALNHDLFHRAFLFPMPRNTHFNEFVKEDCFKVYMHPWWRQECYEFAEVAKLKHDHEWFVRFRIVGGRPRFLFSSSPDFDVLSDDMERDLPRSLNELKEQVQLLKEDVFHDRVKHTVYTLFRDDAGPSHYIWDYATILIEVMIKEHFNNVIRSMESSSLESRLLSQLIKRMRNPH